jgi:hypothetical protein
MEWSIAENRREARIFCQGKVTIFLDDEIRGTLGDLVDISNCGFRVQHNEPRLAPGVEIYFQHRFFRGKARVMWTEAGEGRMESGFQILRE